MDADRGPLSARDRDQSDAGELRQLWHEAGFDDVFDFRQLHRVRSDAKRQNRRVGRIDLGVNRRRRQVGGQKIAGGVDRLLDLLFSDVEADIEAEPQGDDRGAGGALRHHLAQARHLAELPLERRRHRRSHHLRARAWIKGLDLDRRIVDLGQGRERQEPKRQHADEQNRDHQETGRDRTIDEDAGGVHRLAPRRRSVIAPGLASSGWRARGSASTGQAWPGWREPGRGANPRPSRAGLGLPRRCGCGRTLSGAGLVVAAPMMLAGAAGGPGRGSHSALLKPLTASSLRPRGRRVVDDPHLDAVAQTIDAVDHHLVARLQARGDHGVLAVGRPDDHVALGDRRIVVEEIDEIARRAELDRRIGRERRAGHGVDQKADIDELVREQDAIGIVERRPHLDGAGGDVDLAVKGGQRSGRERMDIVAVEHRDRKLDAGIEPRRDARQIALGRREHDADRIDLRDDDDAVGVGGLQIVPGIDEPQARPVR